MNKAKYIIAKDKVILTKDYYFKYGSIGAGSKFDG